MSFIRPTKMAEAFINATVKTRDALDKVDHSRWVQRRVVLNTERRGFAEIREYDRASEKIQS